MDKESFVIDQLYRYEIDQILEGGMGRVLLLTLVATPKISGMEEAIYRRSFVQDRFRIPYRQKLAAKTIKDVYSMRDFERECIIWLGIDEPGIVPLLKVTKVNDSIYALMPRYSMSVKDLLKTRNISRIDLIRLLYEPIVGLSNVYSSKGLIHQDIKPENLLCMKESDNVKVFLSDWGIANLQSSAMNSALQSSRFSFQTMAGFGTLPYMAPERFLQNNSTVGADIFSLGVVFFEILTGCLPYHNRASIEDQILSGDYYSYAKACLSEFSNQKLLNTILEMIHPSVDKRVHEYKYLLKFMKQL